MYVKKKKRKEIQSERFFYGVSMTTIKLCANFPNQLDFRVVFANDRSSSATFIKLVYGRRWNGFFCICPFGGRNGGLRGNPIFGGIRGRKN